MRGEAVERSIERYYYEEAPPKASMSASFQQGVLEKYMYIIKNDATPDSFVPDLGGSFGYLDMLMEDG